MTAYPWYDEVAPHEPLMQGDLIDACPVLVFDRTPEAENTKDFARVVDALGDAHGVQAVRVIVMTQACDLVEDKIRNVILCPMRSSSLEVGRQWSVCSDSVEARELEDRMAKGHRPF